MNRALAEHEWPASRTAAPSTVELASPTTASIGTHTVPPIAPLATEQDVDRAENLLIRKHVAGDPRLIIRADAQLFAVRAGLPVSIEPPEVIGPETPAPTGPAALWVNAAESSPERSQTCGDTR
ncbi:MAG TPA: hypothetical protein VMA77_13075 [Solirubrobacteraceae bacterium]|nr:hypothetical protein [Solirubrobacteraceae bacterium]